jgi:serine/threonine protein kinase
MECCEKNLREMLRPKDRTRTPTLNERKKIAKGVRNGLLYLDKIGIEHRDVKPENILLKETDSGISEPKLIDFGVIMTKRKDKSIREMGYVRRGSKFQFGNYLCK